MKYFLRVLCQNNNPISPEEIIEFIDHGFFFERKPRFILNKKDERNWDISVVYDEERDPVIISTSTNDTASQKAIAQIKFVLERSESSKMKDLISKLVEATVNVYVIEINHGQITDECWEMIDRTEVFIMNQCDGILYTSEYEFFDRKLEKMYNL